VGLGVEKGQTIVLQIFSKDLQISLTRKEKTFIMILSQKKGMISYEI